MTRVNKPLNNRYAPESPPWVVGQADDLVLFAHLIDAGTFSAAAERVGIPKSTLSRRLSALENRLGQRLMTRSTRRLALTDFGERMLEHARRLLYELSEASALAQNEQVQPQGLLRVSMPPDLTHVDLATLLLQFAARYPEVRVVLDLSARRVDLLAERFDLVVRIANQLPDDSTLVATKLHDMQIRLYASAVYLNRFGTPVTPSDLMAHNCLPLISSRGASGAWDLSSAFGQWQGVPPSRLSSNSPATQRALAVSGMGIVALPDVLAADCVAQSTLVQVLPEWSLPSVTVWCVTPGRRLLPLRTKVFIKMLRQSMTGKPAV
uniref:LysR family transcriptional regulator n=1 Tax=Orrella sp. TaxID=1921583 RepID=UPI004047EC38